MPGDIYYNIVGSALLDVEDAWTAARVAGIEADIRALPMGMHTLLMEGAGTFSGGQRQRLMIARAVVGRPRLLFPGRGHQLPGCRRPGAGEPGPGEHRGHADRHCPPPEHHPTRGSHLRPAPRPRRAGGNLRGAHGGPGPLPGSRPPAACMRSAARGDGRVDDSPPRIRPARCRGAGLLSLRPHLGARSQSTRHLTCRGRPRLASAPSRKTGTAPRGRGHRQQPRNGCPCRGATSRLSGQDGLTARGFRSEARDRSGGPCS